MWSVQVRHLQQHPTFTVDVAEPATTARPVVIRRDQRCGFVAISTPINTMDKSGRRGGGGLPASACPATPTHAVVRHAAEGLLVHGGAVKAVHGEALLLGRRLQLLLLLHPPLLQLHQLLDRGGEKACRVQASPLAQLQ